MEWEQGRRSDNVRDRRGLGSRGVQLGGGGILVAVVLTLLGAPQSLVRDVLSGGPSGPQTQQGPRDPAEDKLADFTKVVLADTEDTWGVLFSKQNARYEQPALNLFSGSVQSACGTATSAVGPFYCPGDRQVYLDLGFFRELDQRLGAPGDFAQAYVIAHEIGHHVQNLLGISRRTQAQRSQVSEREANRISVQVELQADCFAGVWGHHTKTSKNVKLDPGDLEEALKAANAIGDDTLQKRGRGHVVPDSFTHGTSEQRIRWFKVGYDSGDPDVCDTFARGV